MLYPTPLIKFSKNSRHKLTYLFRYLLYHRVIKFSSEYGAISLNRDRVLKTVGNDRFLLTQRVQLFSLRVSRRIGGEWEPVQPQPD
jgi:hypothetical protein